MQLLKLLLSLQQAAGFCALYAVWVILFVASSKTLAPPPLNGGRRGVFWPILGTKEFPRECPAAAAVVAFCFHTNISWPVAFSYPQKCAVCHSLEGTIELPSSRPLEQMGRRRKEQQQEE